ncbi:hypothetical protein QTP99_10505 [Caldanaerobacter subterraneus KAk]|uniref:hypothetical protein n=1 Tax=Caldanaerobacter subterraneus TaxID=911092 RepID=UPI0032C02FD8
MSFQDTEKLLSLLKKSPYAGTPYEGLEECLPQFKSASILYYTGKKRIGNRGKRKGRFNYERLKVRRSLF